MLADLFRRLSFLPFPLQCNDNGMEGIHPLFYIKRCFTNQCPMGCRQKIQVLHRHLYCLKEGKGIFRCDSFSFAIDTTRRAPWCNMPRIVNASYFTIIQRKKYNSNSSWRHHHQIDNAINLTTPKQAVPLARNHLVTLFTETSEVACLPARNRCSVTIVAIQQHRIHVSASTLPRDC